MKLTTKSFSVSDARKELSELVNRASYGGERILLRRNGREVAAIVSPEDLRLLEELEDRIDLEDARASLAEAKRKGTIPWAKVKARLGL
jgi:prevent-host-death family protein